VTPTKPTLTSYVKSQSSREGGRPKLIVLHTTEGSDNPNGNADLKGIISLFNSEEASSHVVNNVNGRDARMVKDEAKAWTQCYLNPVSLAIEQIAFSAFTMDQWFERPHQLANTAKWIAHWSQLHGIPIRRGVAPAGYVLRSGVVQHKNLGTQGCGHSDCGSGYPIKYVRKLARYFLAKEQGHPEQAEKLAGPLNRVRRHYGLEPL
jgi:N-acetylmuramoyl-L-alanine amidase-like protein